MNTLKKNKIKIPNNFGVLYCKKQNILTIIHSKSKKSIYLPFKICINKNILEINLVKSKKYNKLSFKKQKSLQGTIISSIKKLLIEVSTTMFKKLKLVGVGYIAFIMNDYSNQILLFKLGFSHFIYYKIPKTLNLFCKKQTQIFIAGKNYHEITQAASLIQSLKKPEPYKGKGILLENEKIILKEGKKI